MAEFVEFRSEEMIPELEELERLRIFEDHEILSIVKSRKNFEYKLQKQTKSKDDFVKYIQYEMDLLKLVRIRRNKLGIPREETTVDMNVANRVNKLFKKAIFQFHDDIRLWLSYIRFCEKVPAFSVCIGYMLVGMLAVHSHRPQLWKLAANWEFEHNGSVDSARNFLLRGLKHHPDSKILYMESFRLELQYTAQKRKQLEEVEMKGNAVGSDSGPSTSMGGNGGSNASESKSGGGGIKEVKGNTTKVLEAAAVASAAGGFNIGGESWLDDNGSVPPIDVATLLAAWGGQENFDENALTILQAAAAAADDGTQPDPVLEGRLAEFIYESASKRIPDVSFLIGMLNIAKNFTFTEKLQARMVKDLLTSFPKDELTWDAMARCELEGMHYLGGGIKQEEEHGTVVEQQDNFDIDISESKLSPEQIVRQRVRNCCQVYALGLQHLGTERMWSMYLDTLLHLYRDPGSLRKFKRRLLRDALQEGHNEGRLQEKYYLEWAAIYSNKKDKLSMVLRAATERHTTSVTLWQMRLNFHLSRGEEDSLMAVFKLAVACLGSDTSVSLCLWKMIIQYWQTKNIDKVEEIFREGIAQGPAISNVLKPMFLEWLVLAKDIAVARQVYQSLCLTPPFCKELHLKMADLECLTPEIDLPRVVKCYELACEQFGSIDTSVWMDYSKFERQLGDSRKVKEVYRRALDCLNKSLSHEFINEFCEYWVIKDL